MMTPRPLNSTSYADLRYLLLVNFEESGDPKENPYLDSVNLPTIGIGFNLTADASLWKTGNTSTEAQWP